MSCYTRHLGSLFQEAGIEFSKQNRAAADRCIRAALNLQTVHCPEVWRAVKPMLADPAQRARLLEALRRIP